MQNNKFHKQRRGLSETQVLFCSHLWKSTFSTKWMKNWATPDLLIQKQKGYGSVALTDYKLCFPAASLKQKTSEKYKATLRVSERNHKPTSWRQKQRARSATCSSSVIPARSPRRRFLTNSGHRTPSVQFLHISATAKVTPDCTSEWCTCTSIFKQPRNRRLTASPVFTWGENQRLTFHLAVMQLELLPIYMYHKNEDKIC